MSFKKITDDFSVAPQISVAEVSIAAEAGFKTVICNRPVDEPGQPDTAEMVQAVENAGMEYLYQPVISGNMTYSDVAEFTDLLKKADKPILAYCRSGTRCSTLWAMAEAPNRDIDEILVLCAAAGYDYSAMRGTLETLKKNSE